MQRPVIGWRLDPDGQWMAELACGHTIHVRHDPPWQVRPWVATAEGRAERLGHDFGCVRCDRGEPPTWTRRADAFADAGRLAEVLAVARDRRAELLAVVRAAPPARLERRPAPDLWSVTEVLDHLYRVEHSIARLVAKLLAEAAATLPPDQSRASALGVLQDHAVEDRGRYIEAPERTRPHADTTAIDALAQLDASRVELEAALADAHGRALDGVRAPHPIFGPLDLYQWILFVAQHEARHTAQIRDVLARLADDAA